MATLALRAEGKELELLAAVEGELVPGDDGAPAQHAVSSEPTMMSQEARNLFLNGDKNSGLAAWKVRGRVWTGGGPAGLAACILPLSALLPIALHRPELPVLLVFPAATPLLQARYYREKMQVVGEAGRRGVVEAYIQASHPRCFLPG